MLIDRDFTPKPKPARQMPTDPKPVLEMVRLPVFRVHYLALNAFVEKVFGFEFDFMEVAGVTPNCGVDYRVQAVSGGFGWDRRASDLRRGKRSKDMGLIFDVLALDGYIPAGMYTVSTKLLPEPTAIYTAMLQGGRRPLDPECVAFKEKHKGDKVFTERAKVLDQAVLDFLRDAG